MRRYPVDTLGQIVTIYMVFSLIFFGGRAVTPAVIEESLEGIVVGFFIWTVSVGAYSSVASDFSKEAQLGTLEMLSMSPLGLGVVMAIKSAVNLLVSFLLGTLVLILMLVTSGVSFSVNVLTVVPLAVLTVLPMLGVGFMMGGLALVYKRVSSVFNILRYIFLVLIIISPDAHPVLRYLPLTLGIHLLTRVMSSDVTLVDIPSSDVLTVTGIALVYLVIGYAGFQQFQKYARIRGVLGHY